MDAKTSQSGKKFPFMTDQSSVKNSAGWMFSPLSVVGSRTAYLPNLPSGSDTASKRGCKSQRYTSWDCSSQSYVCGATVVVAAAANRRRRSVPVEASTFVGDTPTEEELDLLTKAERNLLKEGHRVYIRAKREVMSRHQHQQHLLRSPLAPAQASGVSEEDGTEQDTSTAAKKNVPPKTTTDPPPPENGFFYSDTLPVRVCAVSSMVSKQEEGLPVPFSPVYQAYINRLSDPASTGVLGATIRGPNVRDSTSMTAMAKAMSQRPGTTQEIAAMVRCGCMALSLAEENYRLDPIRLRFIRNLSVDANVMLSTSLNPKPGPPPGPLIFTAAPLDTFLALANNSFFGQAPAGFEYTGFDNDWVAVPMRSNLIGQSHAFPYLMSFLTSEFWSGTVNYMYTTRDDYTEGNKMTLKHTLMPACNSVHIPGCTKLMIVLVDETSDNVAANVNIGGVDIIVWRGRAVVNTTDMQPIWNNFWSNVNIANARRDLHMAHSEICTRLGVGSACGIANSMLAELYGTWYMGLALDQHENSLNPDYTQAADGAWTINGSALDKTGAIKSQKMRLDDDGKRFARRRCVAYNFSAVSPLHQSPTGIVKSQYVVAGGNLGLTWQTSAPLHHTAGYRVTQMTSLYRVGTYIGLILTHEMSYGMGSDHAFNQWSHMLSNALAFSTSALLTLNDLSPREWAGFDDRYDTCLKDNLLGDLKDELYQGLVVNHCIKNVVAGWGEWDQDVIADYYGVNPFDNVNWMTFSPVPYVQTLQWVEKMGMTTGNVNHHVATFRYLGHAGDALQVTLDAGRHKMTMIGTIDVYRQFPQLAVKEAEDGFKYVKHWFDQSSYYSCALSDKNTLHDRGFYTSLTACPQINTLGLSYTQSSLWYVLGSSYVNQDPTYYDTSVSPIRYPDPPLLETLWNGAKNYILKPAASALSGLFTEGPVGALVAGVGHVAQQLATDLGASQSTKNTISSVESAAKGVLGINPKAGQYPTEQTVKQEDTKVPPTQPVQKPEDKKTEEKKEEKAAAAAAAVVPPPTKSEAPINPSESSPGSTVANE